MRRLTPSAVALALALGGRPAAAQPAPPTAPPTAPAAPAPQPAAPAPPPPAALPALPAPARPSNSPGDLKKRESVRGVPFGEEVNESPELAELRRFEELAFGGRDPSKVPAGEYRLADLPPHLHWLRTLKPLSVPVRWDYRLVKYLEFFRNEPRGRAILRTWYARSGRLRHLIEASIERHGLPKELLAIAMIESGFSSGATSRVGAGGVWQMMPGTGAMYGLKQDPWIDERRDPERATEAAMLFFSDLFTRFGSADLAMASYNAGYAAILRSIRRYNSNDFWQLCRYESGLPWETCNYVPKTLAAALAIRNPEAFLIHDITPDPPLRFERVRLSTSVPLARLAAITSTSVQQLRDLNPELRQARTPPGTYELRVPVGRAQALAAAQDTLRREVGDATTITVRLGEDLAAVARDHGTSVAQLRSMNGLADHAEARPGMRLLVPRAGTGTRPGAEELLAEEDEGADDGVLEGDLLLVAVPERSQLPTDRDRVFYRAVAGDTPAEVARWLGVTIEELCEWNDLDLRARLLPGMVVQAFVERGLDRSKIVLLDPRRLRVATANTEEFMALVAQERGRRRILYTARGGETLAKLGRRYGLTAGDLGRINRLTNSAVLQRGQQIVVYEPITAEARQQGRARVAKTDRLLRKFSRGKHRGKGVRPSSRGKSGGPKRIAPPRRRR